MGTSLSLFDQSVSILLLRYHARASQAKVFTCKGAQAAILGQPVAPFAVCHARCLRSHLLSIEVRCCHVHDVLVEAIALAADSCASFVL